MNTTLNPAIDPFPNEKIETLKRQLDISKMEVYRTHWAIKDVDLIAVLLEEGLVSEQAIQKLQTGSRFYKAFHEPETPRLHRFVRWYLESLPSP